MLIATTQGGNNVGGPEVEVKDTKQKISYRQPTMVIITTQDESNDVEKKST